MISFKKLTKAQAKELIDSIDSLPDAAFNDLVEKWHQHIVDDFDHDYDDLRKDVLEKYMLSGEKKPGYETDLNVGLELFKQLNPSKGFTLVMANNDDIWRYISCKVFPDITYERYPTPEKEIKELGGHLNHKRFYSHTRRIWLKTLWWYVFLSWQGNSEKTRCVLEEFGTDTISDLIERTGQGYRVLMYRQLMLSYSHVHNKSSDLFNIIQKQNLVNCRTVEPALVDNAEQGYIKSLFRQLEIGDNNVD